MAFVSPSRVLETASGSGTGNLTLLGASGSGEYDAFNERLSVGDVTFYVIVDGNQFEIGYGTYSSATPSNGTLTRDTVIRSSSGTSKISLSGSTVNVFSDMPPEKVLVEDHNGVVAQVSAILSTVTVADFATLQTFAIPSDGDAIFVRYGVTVGDGKGGKFYWSAGSSATPDTPASDLTVNTIQSSVTGTGRWLRERDFLHPAEIASSASIPVGDVGRISSTKDLVSNNSTRGLMTVPQVANVAAQASYATFAAFKAAASSQWVQNDLIEVRGITADGDIDAPLVGKWEASSTNTTNLDSQYLRPDDITGSNPGRLSFAVPVRAVKFSDSDATPSVKSSMLFTCADTPPSAITTFDDMKDGQKIVVQPGAAAQIFTHSSTFVLPGAINLTLNTSDAPISFYKENGVIRYLSGGSPAAQNVYYPAVAADDTGDWGATIQAAIDLAEAAGGGSVILPPGIIATTTVLTIEKSGVKLIGQGNGFFNAGTQPENPTVIKYKGSSGATVITFSPVSGAGNGRVVGGAIDGISVDGNSLAATGILVRSCTQCRFNMGAKNCTNWQLDFSTVASLAVARDVQSNEIPFLGAEATGSAGGVRFGTTTLGANISYMTIGEVWSRHVDGVGIEYGNCDNLKVLLSRAFRYNSGTGFGQVLKAGDGVTTNNSRAVELYNAYANGGIKIEGLDDGSLPAINNLITYDEENATPFPTIGVGATGNRIFSNLGLSAPFPVTGAPATIKFTDRNGATDESVFQIKRETGDLLFQAVSDVQLTGTDGAITASDNTFTSAAAGFTAGMVGERIIISGAGASGADLATSVASYTSATSIEITAAASTTVSGAAFSIGETGGNAFAIVGSGNAITEIDVRGTADFNIAGGSLKFGDTERIDNSGNATLNSLAFDSGATSWVPTWGATSGSLTTVTVASARYQQIGNVVFYSIIATITDNGTGASALTFTLPSTPLYGGAGTGKNTSTGVSLNTTIAASNATATVHKYDATYPVATGNAIRLTGFYIV